MRRLTPLAVIALALALLGASVAQGHNHRLVSHVKAHAASDWSCYKWASSDAAHPNAPGSYKSYGCQNPDGNWAWVVGTGYSGTIHTTKLHRVCWRFSDGYCREFYVYVEYHGHS